MRILKVWDYEYPWDVRVEKVCKSLSGLGHEVQLLARNRKRQATVETLADCTVHRLRPWPWAGARLDAASQFPAFFNPRWIGHMIRTGRSVRAEVILVRDIPLAPAAIIAGRRLRIPVVLDMAEHYAAMIRDLWDTGTTKFGDAIVRNPKAVEAVERWTLDRVAHTLVVVEESKERLVRNGVPAERVSVVGNTPFLSRLEEYAPLREAAEKMRGSGVPAGQALPLRLGYLGLMEEARGVRPVIEAVAIARGSGIPVTLDLIGDGRSREDFIARAHALGMDETSVRFHGYLPYGEALQRIAGMDVGLIPHFRSESWESTIPNKLFDYMSLGLPVLASEVTPVHRVLSETGAGVTYRDRDAGDLARVIGALYSDPAARLRMASSGLAAIRDRYHFERDATVLEDVLEGVVAHHLNSVR